MIGSWSPNNECCIQNIQSLFIKQNGHTKSQHAHTHTHSHEHRQTDRSMDHRIQRFSSDAAQVQSRICLLVHLSNHRHVVPSDDVKSEDNLLHTLGRAEHPLVALIQDQVDGLVKPLQGAHDHAAIRCHNRDGTANVAFQGGGHGSRLNSTVANTTKIKKKSPFTGL